MTKEEFLAKTKDLRDKIRLLERELSNVKKDYITEHEEHKVGQKAILITKDRWGGKENTRKYNVYVWRNMVTSEGDIYYEFRTVSKEGKRGNEKFYTKKDEIQWLDEYVEFNNKPTTGATALSFV